MEGCAASDVESRLTLVLGLVSEDKYGGADCRTGLVGDVNHSPRGQGLANRSAAHKI